jgi:hypothetical protein
MSTHTTYFCDHCNTDHDYDGSGGAQAINYDYPQMDGWAEFQEPYTSRLGYAATNEIHICAHCLADPEFEPRTAWKIGSWDDESRKNLAKGRAAAEAYDWALEHLGTRSDRWPYRSGVRQVIDDGYGRQFGPLFEDGRLNSEDRVYARAGEGR